jgi:phosphate transport system substrate-binding protein
LIRIHRRARVVVAAFAALAVSGLALAGTAGAQGSGEVNVSGSSTVEPITSLVAELFAEKNPDVSVRVDGPGTGDGFKLFCNDETDISDASRAIKDEEAAACADKGIEYTELPVGIDGLTIVANKASKITCLDPDQIYALFGPESGSGETDLADAQAIATELGSTNKELPSGSVTKFTPGPESGTYDSFIEINYEGLMEERLEAGKIPSDKVGTNDDGEPEVTEPVLSAGQFPNDNDIVKRVEGADDGLGFFGYAYYKENKANLKAIAVYNEELGKCVKPTDKTIQAGDYPVSRTLFIYPNNAKVDSNAAVKDFLDFYITKKSLNSTVKQAGYIPLASADQAATIDAWDGLGG